MYATLDKALATCHHENMHCNIKLKQLKHFKQFLQRMCETCATFRSECLQHASGTNETF
jgi:hypothetical protein